MIDVIVTKVGLSKIAGATAGNPLILEKFAVGDGTGAGEDSTSLVNEKYRDLINDKYSNNNNLVVECVLRGNAEITEGFYLRELGIFDVEGDLIAVAKLPESYRPPLMQGQIVTENVFNITLKVENTENITIAINENIFATTDELNRLLTRVEKLETDKQTLIESSIGIDKWFNTDNRHKDKNIVKLGCKTWALMDITNILNIADYPMLFKNLGAVDKGDGTFAMPTFNDGTLRHLSKGNARDLGSFESDEFKSHTHIQNPHTHTQNPHNHQIGQVYNDRAYSGMVTYSASRHHNEAQQISSDTIATNNVTTATNQNTGGSETRMKNTAGQWYILAKIDF